MYRPGMNAIGWIDESGSIDVEILLSVGETVAVAVAEAEPVVVVEEEEEEEEEEEIVVDFSGIWSKILSTQIDSSTSVSR